MARQAHTWRLARVVVLLGALVLLLTGCSQSGQQQPSDLAKDQTLKLIWTQNGASSMFALDPAHVSEDGSRQVTSLLFDGLVTLDRHGHIEPWGATSWVISPDGLTYTFTLRPNQRFSDGAPVTASDYAWSINRALNLCAGSYIFYDLAAIKNSSALIDQDCSSNLSQTAQATLVGRSILPDDSANRLTILLSQPTGYFLSVLASSAGMALERRVIEPLMDNVTNLSTDDAFLSLLTAKITGQGGSGMFYLARWTAAAYNNPGTLALKPNPHWWGIAAGKKPHFSELDFTVPLSNSNSPPSTGFSLFNSDPTQAFANMLPTNLPITQFNQQPYYHEQPTTGYLALLFYWNNVPFDDINARKAFCLAINREQFNQQIYHGQMMPSWHIISQGMDGYDPLLKGLDSAPVAGDAALAKHYWQLYLAAHNNQAPTITINYGLKGSPDYLEASTWLKNTWNQTLGVQTFPDMSDWGHGPGWEASRQIVRISWIPTYSDPQAIFSNLDPRSPYDVDGSLSTGVPAADSLIRQANALLDIAQRIPLYNQAEQLLIDNVAVCPLYQFVNHYALQTWVKGDFVEDARGMFPTDAWVSGYIAKH